MWIGLFIEIEIGRIKIPAIVIQGWRSSALSELFFGRRCGITAIQNIDVVPGLATVIGAQQGGVGADCKSVIGIGEQHVQQRCAVARIRVIAIE